jgi:hypothetical protein
MARRERQGSDDLVADTKAETARDREVSEGGRRQ